MLPVVLILWHTRHTARNLRSPTSRTKEFAIGSMGHLGVVKLLREITERATAFSFSMQFVRVLTQVFSLFQQRICVPR